MTSAVTPGPEISFYKPLVDVIGNFTKRFDTIPPERKAILHQMTGFIQDKRKHNQKVELTFICTHNSRRSHIAQVWAQAAASFYGVLNVVTYSGGTEATAFNPRAVKTLRDTGFKINQASETSNPVYEVFFSDEAPAVILFSKKYDSESNPEKGFAAVMTCSQADENCPVVLGMEKRISLPYDDPKDFDGTPQESEKYTERINEIGTEMLYAFSPMAGASLKPASGTGA